MATLRFLAQLIFHENDPRRIEAEQRYAIAKLLLSL